MCFFSPFFDLEIIFDFDYNIECHRLWIATQSQGLFLPFEFIVLSRNDCGKITFFVKESIKSLKVHFYNNIIPTVTFSLVFVIEIYVCTVSMASQPCANAGQQTGSLGIIDHRTNSNRSIKSFITFFFFPHRSFHILFVQSEQWWSQLIVYTCSAVIQRCNHSTQMMRNPKDCHGNRAFLKASSSSSSSSIHSFTSCYVGL